MFKCPVCDTPLSHDECSCEFQYRQPTQLGLRLATPSKERKPDIERDPIDYGNV